jgi:hypothetical protein
VIICFVVSFRTTYFFVGHGKWLFVSLSVFRLHSYLLRKASDYLFRSLFPDYIFSLCYCLAPTIPMLLSRRSYRDNAIQRLKSIMPLKYINKLSCHYDPTATVLLLPSRCHCLAPTIPTLPFCRYSPAITVQTLQLIMPFSSRVDCHVFLPAVNINRH